MPTYEVEVSYLAPAVDFLKFEAERVSDAEDMAVERIEKEVPGAEDMVIVDVVEIK